MSETSPAEASEIKPNSDSAKKEKNFCCRRIVGVFLLLLDLGIVGAILFGILRESKNLFPEQWLLITPPLALSAILAYLALRQISFGKRVLQIPFKSLLFLVIALGSGYFSIFCFSQSSVNGGTVSKEELDCLRDSVERNIGIRAEKISTSKKLLFACNQDPTLGIAALYLELSTQLDTLSAQYGLPPSLKLRDKIIGLKIAGALTNQEYSITRELLAVCDDCLHGKSISEGSARTSITDLGNPVLLMIQSKLKHSRQAVSDEIQKVDKVRAK